MVNLLAHSFQSAYSLVLNLLACCSFSTCASPFSNLNISVLYLVDIIDGHSLLSTDYLCRGPPISYS
jgi:hypothetical protein